MTPSEIIDRLQRFEDVIVETVSDGLHPHVRVRREDVTRVCNFLKTDPDLRFDLLRCITAVDWPEKNGIELSYDIMSIQFGHAFAVKVDLDRSQPEIETVWPIWPAAEWHEREAYDLMGVVFTNHPDPRRILMPDDWNGYPLRKDYQDPTEYHGLKIEP